MSTNPTPTPTTSPPTTSAATTQSFDDMDVDDPAVLRRLLSDIDRIGWDSPSGELVLDYAMERIVRPAVRRAELLGYRKSDALGSGWAMAWETLRRPQVRNTPRPWGVVAAAVRCEISTEEISAAYRTYPREAWRLAQLNRTSVNFCAAAPPAASAPSILPAGPGRDHGQGSRRIRRQGPNVLDRPISLDGLIDGGWEPPALSPAEALGPRLSQVVDALVGVGWPRDLTVRSVTWIATAVDEPPERYGVAVELPGWRELAEATGLPTWRTRRLVALLLGYRGQPGLLARMVLEGDQVLRSPEVRRLVRSTVRRWVASPCAAARSTPSAA